jgi:hypothetical protein
MKQRSAHPDDIKTVQSIAESVTREVQNHPDTTTDKPLEEMMSAPLPDNPLVEGVGTTFRWCGEGAIPEGVDWLYCPESRTVKAVIPLQ